VPAGELAAHSGSSSRPVCRVRAGQLRRAGAPGPAAQRDRRAARHAGQPAQPEPARPALQQADRHPVQPVPVPEAGRVQRRGQLHSLSAGTRLSAH